MSNQRFPNRTSNTTSNTRYGDNGLSSDRIIGYRPNHVPIRNRLRRIVGNYYVPISTNNAPSRHKFLTRYNKYKQELERRLVLYKDYNIYKYKKIKSRLKTFELERFYFVLNNENDYDGYNDDHDLLPRIRKFTKYYRKHSKNLKHNPYKKNDFQDRINFVLNLS